MVLKIFGIIGIISGILAILMVALSSAARNLPVWGDSVLIFSFGSSVLGIGLGIICLVLGMSEGQQRQSQIDGER